MANLNFYNHGGTQKNT